MIYAHIPRGCFADWDNPAMNAYTQPTAPPPQGGEEKKNYYDEGGVTVLDVIKAKLTPEQYKGYLLGNIIKCSLRFNFKGVSKQDAHKLADYSRWLDELENGNDLRGN